MSGQSTDGPTVSNTANITSGVKEKNPRRVAAGKRLGAISRQAKEAKRLEREKQAQQSATIQAQEETGNGYTLYFVGGLIVVGTLSYLFLNKDRLTSQAKRSNPSNQKITPADPAEKPLPKKKPNRIFANE